MENGVISVWGMGGAGKTTIAAAIGASLATKGKIVGIICADMSYSSMQHILSIKIPDAKGLKYVLKDLDDEAAKGFVVCPKIENLFVLELPERENCFSIDALSEEDAEKLIAFTKDRFDFLIIDCTSDIKNALTFLANYSADKIIEVIKASITNFKYRLSHQIYFEEMGLAAKTISVINMDKGLIDLGEVEKALSLKLPFALPYTRTVQAAEGDGEILTKGNMKTRNDKKYLKAMDKLMEEILR